MMSLGAIGTLCNGVSFIIFVHFEVHLSAVYLATDTTLGPCLADGLVVSVFLALKPPKWLRGVRPKAVGALIAKFK